MRKYLEHLKYISAEAGYLSLITGSMSPGSLTYFREQIDKQALQSVLVKTAAHFHRLKSLQKGTLS